MRNLIAFALLFSLGLTACSGQGTFTYDVKANTPTPGAGTTPTLAAQTEEPPSPAGAQETTTDKLSPDIVAFIQVQLMGQSTAGSPRVFIIHQNVMQVETQYNQQLSTRGWRNVSSSPGLGGKAKVMVMEKGKMKTHVIFVGQSDAETIVYVTLTKV